MALRSTPLAAPKPAQVPSQQVADAVTVYFAANPVAPAIASAAAAYIAAHPPADGKSVEIQVAGGFIQWRLVGGAWTNLVSLASLMGAPGASGATLIGTVTLAQTAAIAIALGIREVTVALAGVAVGTRYIAFCDSYRLNGGASTPGRPAGYSLVDCVCNVAGQITVSLNAPLLAIGQSYALTVSVVRLNAS